MTPAHRRIPVFGAHGPLDEDGRVEILGPGERVDEVARIGEGDVAACEAGEIDAAGPALLVRPDEDLVLVRVAAAAEEEPDAR